MRHSLLRRRLIVLGAFIGVVALLVVFLKGSSRELELWKQDKIARGERFTLAEIAPPFSQAAVDWELSLGSVASRLVDYPHNPGLLGLMATNSLGFAPSILHRTDPTSRQAANFWPEFMVQLGSNSPVIAEVRALLQARPRGSTFDPTSPFGRTLDMVARRKIAQGISGAAVGAMRANAHDQVLTNIAALLDLSKSVAGEQTVERSICGAIAQLALQLTWEFCQLPGVDEAHLSQLSRLWANADLFQNLDRVVEMERALVEFCFELARTNLTEKRNLFVAPGSQPFSERVLNTAFDVLWRSTSLEKDEYMYLRTMQPLMEGARAASSNGNYSGMRARLKEHVDLIDAVGDTRFARFRYSLTLLASQSWGKFMQVMWKREAFRRVTLAAIAVNRYRLRQGRFPDTLAALAPDLLPAESQDPMSGQPLQPLRYRPLSAEEFVLYSVGENGKDDGGLGDDIYWPRLDRSRSD